METAAATSTQDLEERALGWLGEPPSHTAPTHALPSSPRKAVHLSKTGDQ